MKYQFFAVLITLSQCLHAQLSPYYTPLDQGHNLSFRPNKSPWTSRPIPKTITTPVLLFGMGLYAMTDNNFINRHEFKEERDEYFSRFRHRADDYLQYAPIVAVYGLNACGIKGRNDFANRTALFIKSELIMSALTFSLKQVMAVPRPDTGQPTSFPSGHTAQAFAAATFMVKEYGNQSIWYSVSAYSVASGIGLLRVMNNRHWISDVLAGAAVGILSTNVAYLTHQYKWGKRKTTSHPTVILPTYDGRTGMVSFVRTI